MSQQAQQPPEQMQQQEEPVQATGAPPPIMATPETTAPNPLQSMIEQSKERASILEQQIARMQANLERRTQLPFDPALMKLATGLLAPTRTGRFGESLGAGMNAYSEEAQNQIERNQKIEAMKLELAQKSLANRQQIAGMDVLGQMFNAQPTGQAPAGPQMVGQPMPPMAGQPMPQMAMAEQPQATPASGMPRRITPQDVMLANLSGNAQVAKMVSDQYEIQKSSDDRAMRERELATKETGVEQDVPGVGRLKLPQKAWNQFNAAQQAASNGDVQPLLQWFRAYNIPMTGTVTPSGIQFPSQAEIAAGAAEREAIAKGSAAQIVQLQGNAKSATDAKAMADEAIALARSNPNAFKLLQNADVQSGIQAMVNASLEAAKQGISTPWGSISLPTDVFAKIKISPEDYMALQKFAQLEALSTVQNRRTWLQGQGAVANAENNLVASIGPKSTDRPEVIVMKANATKIKADFDEKTYSLYDQWVMTHPNGSFQRFVNSDEFKALKDEYLDILKAEREKNDAFFRGKPGSSPLAAPSSASGKTLIQRLTEQAQNRGMTQ